MFKPDSNDPGSKYGRELKILGALGVGGCVDVEVEGDRLYMVCAKSARLTEEFDLKKNDSSGVLHIADISRPSAPRLLGSAGGLGTVRQMEVRDGIVFVASREDGLFIIDATDPYRPCIISHHDTVEFATGIDVYGKLAFIANRIHGLEVADISDLRHPVHLCVLRTGEAQSVDAADGYAYVGTWGQRELAVCDIREPYKAKVVVKIPLDGKGDGVFVRGRYCYIATGHHARGPGNPNDVDNPAYGCGNGLEIYDISKPGNPKLVSRIKVDKNYTEFNHMWTVTVSGKYAFLAHSYIGLFVIDVSVPEAPVFVARVSLPNDTDDPMVGSIAGIALTGGYVYIAGMRTDVFIAEAEGLAEKVVVDSSGDLYIDGHTLADKPKIKTSFTAGAGRAGEGTPEFKVYKPEGQVYSVAVKNGSGSQTGQAGRGGTGSCRSDVFRLYAACGADGIHIIETGKQLSKVRRYVTDGFAMDIKIRDDTAYVAEANGGLSVWKLTGDCGMEMVGRYMAYNKPVRHVVVPGDGRYVLLQAGSRWFQIADVTDPGNITLAFADSPEKGKGMISGKQIGDGPDYGSLINGRFTCCFWHITGIYWYDVYGGEKPVYSGYCQHERISLNSGIAFKDGSAILTRNKGYVLLDYKYGGKLDDLEHYFLGGGVNINGKPAVYGNTMFVTDRMSGNVAVIDIAEIRKPVLARQFKINGNPDLAVLCGSGRQAAIPAGYQGLLLFDL